MSRGDEIFFRKNARQYIDPRRPLFVTLRCFSFTKFEMVLLSKLSEGGVFVEVFSIFAAQHCVALTTYTRMKCDCG